MPLGVRTVSPVSRSLGIILFQAKFLLVGIKPTNQGSGFLSQVPFPPLIDKARFDSGGISLIQIFLHHALLHYIIGEHSCVLHIILPEKTINILCKFHGRCLYTIILPIQLRLILPVCLFRKGQHLVHMGLIRVFDGLPDRLGVYIQKFLIAGGVLELLDLRRKIVLLGLPQGGQLLVQGRDTPAIRFS